MSLLATIGTKIASSAAGAFFSANKLPIFAGVAVVIAATIGLLWYGNHSKALRIEELSTKIGTLQQVNDQLLHTAQVNSDSLELCRSVSENEAKRVADLTRQLWEASSKIRLLNQKVDRDIEDIKRESKEFNTALPCPAYTLDFRKWVRGD